ncbi:MAG: ribonuclease III [Alphaproteobacteria bacterium]|nr:ribonuclease III [Alphaproteobacteria bacterium]
MVPRPVEELYPLLGHVFRTPALLVEALTHSSVEKGGAAANPRDYERLEFLGDRVLGLAIATHLLAVDGTADAGSLSRRHATLVREEALEAVARQFGLGDFLLLSRAERDAGGAAKRAILADCCEAVIGALYLDGGLDAAIRFIGRYWKDLAAGARNVPKDAKTSLQEWAQAQGMPPPVYVDIDRAGPDHDPVFTVEVHVEGFPAARGSGPNKRTAQQCAAAVLLKRVTDNGR